jgi:hypothetical protein
MVGAPAIARPLAAPFAGRVLERIEQPAEGRVRLVLATREPGSGRAIKVRVNVPLESDRSGLAEGALVRLQARLMPPAPPMLPGGYDFARAAWFEGLAATGGLQGECACSSVDGVARRSRRCSGASPITCGRGWRAPRARSQRHLQAATAGRSILPTSRRCAIRACRTCSRSAGFTSAR